MKPGKPLDGALHEARADSQAPDTLEERRARARLLVALGQQQVALRSAWGSQQFLGRKERHMFQLLDGHRLLAVCTDEAHPITVRHVAVPSRIASAQWVSRPVALLDRISGFDSYAWALPVWLYAQVMPKVPLPQAVAQRALHLPKLPNLPLRYLKDRQLKLFEVLHGNVASLTQLLAEHPSIAHHRMGNDLLGLYWANLLQVQGPTDPEREKVASAWGRSVPQALSTSVRSLFT